MPTTHERKLHSRKVNTIRIRPVRVLTGTQIFKQSSLVLSYVLHIFLGGKKNFQGGALRPS